MSAAILFCIAMAAVVAMVWRKSDRRPRNLGWEIVGSQMHNTTHSGYRRLN